ncbi:hypothetical protein RB195_017036 [Necator americanus]|uniref:Mos1 transposase HTH domain-containing protein n=1 Tax=Necator americanus TaxID=51031 RepID=A0ABR1C3A3_NECAM
MDPRDFHLLALYEFKLGHEAADAARSLQRIFGETAPQEKTVREWFTRFLAGDDKPEDAKRTSRSSSPGSIPVRLDDFVKKLMEPQPGKSWSDVVKEVGSMYNSMWNHTSTRRKKSDQPSPQESTERYLITRLELCSSLLLRNKDEPFTERIFTCGEKWLSYDSRKRASEWLDPDEPSQSTSESNVHPQNRIMVTVWWSPGGLIHYRFLNPGQGITTESFNSELELAHQKMQTQQPAPSNRKNPIFLYDASRAHVDSTTLKKLYELGVEVLPHPSHSPDLLPTEFHFFHALDKFIKEKRFRDEDEPKEAFKQFLDSLDTDFYADGMKALVSRWEKCIEHNGAYI